MPQQREVRHGVIESRICRERCFTVAGRAIAAQLLVVRVRLMTLVAGCWQGRFQPGRVAALAGELRVCRVQFESGLPAMIKCRLPGIL